MKHLYLLSIVLILFSCNTFQNQKKNNNPIQTIETITVLGDTLHSPEIKDGKSLDQFKSWCGKHGNKPTTTLIFIIA